MDLAQFNHLDKIITLNDSNIFYFSIKDAPRFFSFTILNEIMEKEYIIYRRNEYGIYFHITPNGLNCFYINGGKKQLTNIRLLTKLEERVKQL